MRAFYPSPYLCIFALRSFNANFVVYHYFFLFYTITKLKQRSWIIHDLLTLICDAVSQVVAKRKKKTLLHVYDGNNTALYKGITIRVNSRGFLISKNFSKFFFFPVAQCMYFNMYAKRHATVFFFFPFTSLLSMYIAFTSPPFVPNFLSNLYRDFRVESFSKIRSMTLHTFRNWQISFSFDTLAPLFPRPLLWKTHVILFYSPVLLLPGWWQHVFLFLHTFFLAYFRLFQVDRKFISRGKKRKKKHV